MLICQMLPNVGSVKCTFLNVGLTQNMQKIIRYIIAFGASLHVIHDNVMLMDLLFYLFFNPLYLAVAMTQFPQQTS